MASHSFGAVQDILADREAGISSIATVFGARLTVLLSCLLYILSSIVLFNSSDLAAVVGVINLFYVGSVIPFINVNDKTAETTRAGWKRFLIINYITGALITLILIGEFLTK